MATIARGTNTPSKEKRGTSPSTGPKSTSTKPSQTDSTTASSGKLVPNYLKPTRSSGPDAAANSKTEGKRPVSSDGAQKPNLARRRSFDKPPPSSPIQKLRASANLRSSSFSGKTTVPVHKPVVTDNKGLKSSKDAIKTRVTNARPVVKKTTAIYVKKGEAGTSSTISKPKEQTASTPEKVDPPTASDLPKPEPLVVEDRESPIIKEDVSTDEKEADQVEVVEDKEEKITTDNSEEEKDDKIVDTPDIKTEEPEMEKTTVEETVSFEPAEEEKNAENVPAEPPAMVETKEPEQEKSAIVEESEINQEEIKHTINEIASDHETVAVNPIDEDVEHKEEEKQKVDITSEVKETGVNEETVLDKKDEVDTVSESKIKDVQVEQKKITENVAPKQQTVAHGKKDNALSNDVIEETANKLREQRKNKVKALAGAFETVISLQEK